MTRRQAIEGAGYFIAPAALVIGASVGMLALLGVDSSPYGGEVAQPGPQPTVTVTATQAEQTPAPRASRTARERPVVVAEPADRPAASRRSEDRPAASSGRSGGSSRSSSAPRPAPAPSTTPPAVQPDSCDGAVSVRLPLGVLPRCGITIGGSK